MSVATLAGSGKACDMRFPNPTRLLSPNSRSQVGETGSGRRHDPIVVRLTEQVANDERNQCEIQSNGHNCAARSEQYLSWMAVAELAGLAPYINWPEFFERTGTPPVSELNVRVSN